MKSEMKDLKLLSDAADGSDSYTKSKAHYLIQ